MKPNDNNKRMEIRHNLESVTPKTDQVSGYFETVLSPVGFPLTQIKAIYPFKTQK
jgi:hypothetical protein